MSASLLGFVNHSCVNPGYLCLTAPTRAIATAPTRIATRLRTRQVVLSEDGKDPVALSPNWWTFAAG